MSGGPVVVVGAGPAGLAAALELRRRGVGEVLVLEREAEPRGTRATQSIRAFGLRDLGRRCPALLRAVTPSAPTPRRGPAHRDHGHGLLPGGPLEPPARVGPSIVTAAVVLVIGSRGARARRGSCPAHGPRG